ncbi:hypothetical protein B0H13DRAFT_2260980 [Mycena leptocephala]|nr:hypothetical protein B0H13DRAFT_2260980 [Mycena leptocephala]
MFWLLRLLCQGLGVRGNISIVAGVLSLLRAWLLLGGLGRAIKDRFWLGFGPGLVPGFLGGSTSDSSDSDIVFLYWYRFRGSRTKIQGLMRESVGTKKNFPKRKFFVRALCSDISCKAILRFHRHSPCDYVAWLGSKELSRLTTAQIHAFLSDTDRKAGDLKEGYEKALDPAGWEEEHAANPPGKKRKNKSKKGGDDDEEDDELGDEAVEGDAEAEDGEEDDKKSKKRKRAASPAPKSKPKPKAATGKAKKGGKAKKSKAAVESEDDAAAEEGEAEAEDGEAERKEERPSKKSKGNANAEDVNAKLESDPQALKVREWRHKLQKTFLSNNKALPKEDEMPTVDALFTTVEGYQNMNIGYLTFSKIGKVMHHIHLLDAAKVARDDEFHFRDRAKALVDKWHEILNSNSTT